MTSTRHRGSMARPSMFHTGSGLEPKTPNNERSVCIIFAGNTLLPTPHPGREAPSLPGTTAAHAVQGSSPTASPGLCYARAYSYGYRDHLYLDLHLYLYLLALYLCWRAQVHLTNCFCHCSVLAARVVRSGFVWRPPTSDFALCSFSEQPNARMCFSFVLPAYLVHSHRSRVQTNMRHDPSKQRVGMLSS